MARGPPGSPGCPDVARPSSLSADAETPREEVGSVDNDHKTPESTVVPHSDGGRRAGLHCRAGRSHTVTSPGAADMSL